MRDSKVVKHCRLQSLKSEDRECCDLTLQLVYGYKHIYIDPTYHPPEIFGLLHAFCGCLLDRLCRIRKIFNMDYGQLFVASFCCTLDDGKQLNCGKMYVFKDYVCFYRKCYAEKELNLNIVLEVKEIKDLIHRVTSFVFNNQINIQMKDGRAFMFRTFVNRDYTKKILQQLIDGDIDNLPMFKDDPPLHSYREKTIKYETSNISDASPSNIENPQKTENTLHGLDGFALSVKNKGSLQFIRYNLLSSISLNRVNSWIFIIVMVFALLYFVYLLDINRTITDYVSLIFNEMVNIANCIERLAKLSQKLQNDKLRV